MQTIHQKSLELKSGVSKGMGKKGEDEPWQAQGGKRPRHRPLTSYSTPRISHHPGGLGVFPRLSVNSAPSR